MRAPRTLIAELSQHAGETVRVCGWVDAVRGSEIAVRDHTGLVELAPPDGLQAITVESAIEVHGTVTDGGSGLRADRVEVLGPAPAPLPLGPESSALEQRLDWRYLDLRRPRNRLIFEVQTTAERALRAFCAEHGFLEVHSPRLRALPNKSGDQLFRIDYFGQTAYLAQSPQFHKQMAMSAGFDRVLDIGPVFRAQPELSSRHAAEFTSVDLEIAWIDSLEDLLSLEEQLLRRLIGEVSGAHGREISRLLGVELRVPELPFPRVGLGEAKRIVEASGWPPGPDEEDLDAEGERRLAAAYEHEFVFVIDYPDRSRPFYHMRCTENSVETRSFDLLWKGLEITSGAQREHRYERLVAQARARGLPVQALASYLDFFRFGAPPHGGFGIGLERLLMSMLELGDVREASYLYRGADRLSP